MHECAVFMTDYLAINHCLIGCGQKEIAISLLLRQGNLSMAQASVWEFLPLCGSDCPPTNHRIKLKRLGERELFGATCLCSYTAVVYLSLAQMHISFLFYPKHLTVLLKYLF